MFRRLSLVLLACLPLLAIAMTGCEQKRTTIRSSETIHESEPEPAAPGEIIVE